MKNLGHRGQMTCEVSFGSFRHALPTLPILVSKMPLHLVRSPPTHPIKTYFGSVVFGSFTLTNANCTRPSEKSSIKSTSSPSRPSRQVSKHTGTVRTIWNSTTYPQCSALSEYSLFHHYLAERRLPEGRKLRRLPTGHKLESLPRGRRELQN